MSPRPVCTLTIVLAENEEKEKLQTVIKALKQCKCYWVSGDIYVKKGYWDDFAEDDSQGDASAILAIGLKPYFGRG